MYLKLKTASVAGLLLANGAADVNVRDNHSHTPWHNAASAGHNDVAQLLGLHGGHE